MAERNQEAVRAAGAPMVPRDRPSWAHPPETSGTSDRPGEGIASEAAGQLKAAGGQVLEDSRARARSEVDDRSTWAGERVAAIAGDVRDVAGDLRARGKDQPARIAEDAAARIERFGSYLREADTDRIIADARSLTRRQPALVVAGAAVLGIAAGRFVKASDASHPKGGSHG